MAVKTCPFCGHSEDDGKVYRLAIYVRDQRLAIIPAGTATFAEAKSIVQKTPDAYLMQEVLDSNGRITYSNMVGESLFTADDNGVMAKKH